ncbi:hypothetical protein PoB_006945600 [Plakobranchus ocellatus]|uniref:Uncharacterized protein n=1 Tax=Plakobranchus ocellatus TaxID=259542 RepID=A0AAV4DFJ8_9GAST|nr:hypothetical protein PoB_006945600 [Plakobranchus ocellatus]
MDKGKPLPTKEFLIKENYFKMFEADPGKSSKFCNRKSGDVGGSRPVLKTRTKEYGWNIGPDTHRLEYLDFLTKVQPWISIIKQLGWPWGSQDMTLTSMLGYGRINLIGEMIWLRS